MESSASRAARLTNANMLLETIAGCGRHFFLHKGEVSRLELDVRGRIWFVDSYTKKRVYTHYDGRWRGFAEGGTLRSLIKQLCLYVQHGVWVKSFMLGPWPAWLCEGDLWGYRADMEQVRQRATTLGIIKDPDAGEPASTTQRQG